MEKTNGGPRERATPSARIWRSQLNKQLSALHPQAQQPHVHLHAAVILSYISLVPSFFKEIYLLKIFYLSHISFVLSTDCTVVIYVTRQTKLNHTCIYFEDVYNSSNLCVN